MKPKLKMLLASFLLVVFSFCTTLAQGQDPTVYTDRNDYLPGDTVIVLGYGWQAGEQVRLDISYSKITQGNTTFYTIADESGGIYNKEFVIQNIHLGESFVLTATSLLSDAMAQTRFTDVTFTSRVSGSWNAVNTWKVARTGRITTNTASVVVEGEGTLFLSELSAGDMITTDNDAVALGQVKAIESDTRLLLEQNAAQTNTGILFSARRVPGPADNVLINAHSVTVSQSASCANLNLTNYSTVSVDANTGLTISGALTLQNSGLSNNSATITGLGTINTQNIIVGDNTDIGVSYTINHALTSRISFLNVAQNIFINSFMGKSTVRLDNGRLFVQTGVLTIGGSLITYNRSYYNDSWFNIAQAPGNATIIFKGGPDPIQIDRNGSNTFNFNGAESVFAYTGATDQKVFPATYNNLILGGAGIKKVDGIYINKKLSMQGAATASATSLPQYPGTAILEYKGDVSQTTGPEFSEPVKLVMNNPYGVTLNSNKRASTVLLTNGVLHTGPYKLTVSSMSALPGGSANSYIHGNLELSFNIAGSWLYPMGSGGVYRPVKLECTALSGYVNILIQQVEEPLTGTLPGNTFLFPGPYWSISKTSGTSFAYNITFNATGTTVPANAQPVILKRNNTVEAYEPIVNGTDYSLGGQTSFGDFALGYKRLVVPTTTSVATVTSTYGDNEVIMSATVMAEGGEAPDVGTVSFYLKDYPGEGTNTPIGSAPVSKGLATLRHDPHFLSVGTYTIAANYSGDGLFEESSSDLVAGGANGRLSVSPCPLTVTADAQQKTYGDPDPVFSYQITSGQLAGTDRLTGELTRVQGENAGTYAIGQHTLSAGTNYILTYVPAGLVINPREVTLTADAVSKTYGDPDPALTFSATGLVGSETLSGSLSRVAGENTGTYNILQGTVTESNNPNYSIRFIGASLVVQPRPVVVSAARQNKVYGDPDPVWTYSISPQGVVSSDDFTGTLSREPGETAGEYTITQGSLALTANYDLKFEGAWLVIERRPITVTADTKSKIYGDADPELTYQITRGSLVPGDAFSGGLERAAGETVGQYGITEGSLALNSNYEVSVTGATLLIQRRPAAVTIRPATKVYGDKDPDLAPELKGFLESDHITAQYSRVGGENVADGPYAITATLEPAAALANYDITYTTDYLTIIPRKIKVGAKPKGKLAGDQDPSLEYEVVSGGEFLGSGNITGALERDPGEDRGNYPIKRGSLALASNYELEFQGAAFTIYAKPVVALSIPEPTQVGTVSSILATIGPDVFEPVWQYAIPSPGMVTRSENGLTINSPTPVVYAVSLKYKDGVGGGHETPKVYAVFFDPSAGFVTGSGWINSREGAFAASKGKSGKANFGFVSKYEKGKTVPTGNTEFQFQAADMTFKSTAYEYLVIGGSKAQYKGSGTINGTGDYGFMLTAIDDDGTGPADKFRIRIWDKSTGATAYDNQMGDADDADPTTVIGGGTIVIHSTTKGKTATTTAAEAHAPEERAPAHLALTAFPNPSASSFNVLVQSNNPKEPITVRVLDLYGRTVEVVNGVANGQTLRIGSTYRPGIYFVEMIQGTRRRQVELLKQANGL